jgi:hypothetical protein
VLPAGAAAVDPALKILCEQAAHRSRGALAATDGRAWRRLGGPPRLRLGAAAEKGLWRERVRWVARAARPGASSRVRMLSLPQSGESAK